MLGPHIISPMPGKARVQFLVKPAWQDLIPESCPLLIFYVLGKQILSPKAQVNKARERPEPETQNYSWNGPRPEPVSPGSMLGPHYISWKPNEAQAWIVPKPAGFFESPRWLVQIAQGLIAKFTCLDRLKVKFCQARQAQSLKLQSSCPTQSRKFQARSSYTQSPQTNRLSEPLCF